MRKLFKKQNSTPGAGTSYGYNFSDASEPASARPGSVNQLPVNVQVDKGGSSQGLQKPDSENSRSTTAAIGSAQTGPVQPRAAARIAAAPSDPPGTKEPVVTITLSPPAKDDSIDVVITRKEPNDRVGIVLDPEFTQRAIVKSVSAGTPRCDL